MIFFITNAIESSCPIAIIAREHNERLWACAQDEKGRVYARAFARTAILRGEGTADKKIWVAYRNARDNVIDKRKLKSIRGEAINIKHVNVHFYLVVPWEVIPRIHRCGSWTWEREREKEISRITLVRENIKFQKLRKIRFVKNGVIVIVGFTARYLSDIALEYSPIFS